MKMAENNDRFERASATVVVVSFDARERAACLQDRLHLPFVIALDSHRHGYRSFALRRASFLRTYTHPGVVSFYARALLQRHIPGLHRGQ
ncbi:MAG: hypothetical protein H0U04_11525, partial [Rubrobacter sp.]|nr:hypothetical protein [Rubrobacter sp.]